MLKERHATKATCERQVFIGSRTPMRREDALEGDFTESPANGKKPFTRIASANFTQSEKFD
jgi:hypothetical protein